MYLRLVRMCVFVITVLAAGLLTGAITDYLMNYKQAFSPLAFTLLAMAVSVLVLVPAFALLNKALRLVSRLIFRQGKSLLGPYLGLLGSFAFLFLILLYFYFFQWYHVNVFHYMFRAATSH